MSREQALEECRRLIAAHQIAEGEIAHPNAQFTRCPSLTHDPRFQVDPQSRPYGAGFAAVGVGRDVDTGSEWGGKC